MKTWDGKQAEIDRVKARLYDMKRQRAALVLDVNVLDSQIERDEALLEKLSSED